MAKAKLRLDNSRTPEQTKRMKLLAKEIGCFFCKNNYLKVGASPAIYQSKYWYVKKNDYPYEGSGHHYLLASKSHSTIWTRKSGDINFCPKSRDSVFSCFCN